MLTVKYIDIFPEEFQKPAESEVLGISKAQGLNLGLWTAFPTHHIM